MALVNKTFSVSVTPGEMPPIVHVSEYDVGRAYTVSILDEQGNTFTIPTGTTASIEGTLNGSVGFTQSATISNNQITFALTESMTAYSGKAWCKVKLVQNSQPIQTCAFVLAVDRAGVEAGTVIGASGFEQQITDAVDAWLDEHPPASGGMTEAFKQALLDCFENVAWINDDGQTYYDALYTALYPSADLLSISAVFTQGSAVIYDTDALDTLKQYLVVTATMTDSTTQTVNNYTLSGTLTVGTSTITVSYGGKTATFTVTVTKTTIANKIFTATGNRFSNQYHLCAIIAKENISLNDQIDFVIEGSEWNTDPSVNVSSQSQFYFGDNSGEVSNSQYTEGGAFNVPEVKTGDNGNYTLTRSGTYSVNVSGDYIKLIMWVGTASPSFKIGNISVTVNGVEREIVAFGGFFTEETFTITGS